MQTPIDSPGDQEKYLSSTQSIVLVVCKWVLLVIILLQMTPGRWELYCALYNFYEFSLRF